MTRNIAGCESSSFHLNPSAPAFRPDTPDLSEQSAFVQALYSPWNLVAPVWQESAPSASVITWFVDHRYPFPQCHGSRIVQLHENWGGWEATIRSRWQDSLDHRMPHENHLVTPTPDPLESGIASPTCGMDLGLSDDQ